MGFDYLHFSGIWLEIISDTQIPVGTSCFVNYKDENGLTWYGVQGVRFPFDPQSWPYTTCLPISAIQTEVPWYTEYLEYQMANWIILSVNELANQLNIQTNDIVRQVGTSGGGGGGFTSADRALLNSIGNNILLISNSLNTMKVTITNKLNTLDTRVTNIQTNMILDHNSIEAAIVSGGGLTDEGLIAGIGDLLGSAWSWMTDLITEFTGYIDMVWDMAIKLADGIGEAYWEALTSLVDGLNVGLAFMASELTFAFDNIFALIRIPLEALGDIFDLFISEFFEWLEGTFTIDIGEIETGAVTLLETFRRLMSSYISETQGTN